MAVGQHLEPGGLPPAGPGGSPHSRAADRSERAYRAAGGGAQAGGGEPLPVGLQVGVREYLWLVVFAAAALLLYWVRVWHGPMPTSYWQMAMFVALAVAAQHFPL